jgi:phosphoglycerate kinase
MMPIKWLENVENEVLANRRVLCRVDFNVPMDDAGNILDASKIELTLPTLRKLLRAQAKVIIASHLGRPKGKVRAALTLEPVASYLRDLLSQEVTFVHDCVGDGIVKLVKDANPGQIIFLENLRFHGGEEKNDAIFAKILAKNADVYVNDAFGAVHRAHASIEGVHEWLPEAYGGLLLKKEVMAFESFVHRGQRPKVAIVGGSKVSSKIGVLAQLLKSVDSMLIGGAMAYTFLRAQGHEVGASLVEEDKIILASGLLRKAQELNVKIYLPVDHVVTSNLETMADVRCIATSEFKPGDIGADIGPKTAEIFAGVIGDAKTCFWNGPVGIYDQAPFAGGTKRIAHALADSECYSFVGGGDSIAAIKKFGIQGIDFISTGGGAGLEFLEGKELPGLKILGYYS